MKLVLIAVVALVLGLAGGTGFVVLRAPKPKPPTAPAAAAAPHDSVKVAAHPAPVPAPAAAPAAAPAHADSNTAAGPPIEAAVANHVSPVRIAPLPQAPDPAAAAAARLEGFQQLGRIFGKMQTADAVKIMSYLGDDDVSRVLATLNVRQAASLLAALPSERAARLSRRMIDQPDQRDSAGPK